MTAICLQVLLKTLFFKTSPTSSITVPVVTCLLRKGRTGRKAFILWKIRIKTNNINIAEKSLLEAELVIEFSQKVVCVRIHLFGEMLRMKV